MFPTSENEIKFYSRRLQPPTRAAATNSETPSDRRLASARRPRLSPGFDNLTYLPAVIIPLNFLSFRVLLQASLNVQQLCLVHGLSLIIIKTKSTVAFSKMETQWTTLFLSYGTKNR